MVPLYARMHTCAHQQNLSFSSKIPFPDSGAPSALEDELEMVISKRIVNAACAASCLVSCFPGGDCLVLSRPFGRPVPVHNSGHQVATCIQHSPWAVSSSIISTISSRLTMVTSESSNDQGNEILNDKDLLKSVSLDMLKDIASQQGVSADGSKVDILKRLREYVSDPGNIKSFKDDSEAMDDNWVEDIDFEDVDSDWIDDLDDTEDMNM